MDFITTVSLALVVSGVVSLVDWLFLSKTRQTKLEAVKQKKRSIDYVESQKILAKPDHVVIANNIFGLSVALSFIWLMLPNFELILVVALTLSLVVTLIEKLYLEKRKKKDLDSLYKKNPNPHEQQIEDTKQMPWWIDYGWSFFPLLLAIVLLRSFFFEPFKIPSGSMKPTLWVHDFILVNKYAYGLRLPVTKTKLTNGDNPKRGDVVVFRAPREPQKDYIKRMIGLPGDTVFYDRNNNLYIIPKCDGSREETLKCNQKNLIGKSLKQRGGFEGADAYIENIDGVSHQMMIDEREPKAGYPAPWSRGIVVPDNEYFVLGDNRTGSSDSRFWGFVPDSMMVGKAEYVWLHLEFELAETGLLSYIPTGVKFDRLGSIK